MTPITLEEAEYIVHKLADSMFTKLKFDEPIPPFASRFPNRLESCLNQPFVRFDGIDLYDGLERKAIALFYFCINNHPFENGNKRFAVTILLVFLALNNKWLEIHPTTLYEIAKTVASSTDKPGNVISELEKSLGPAITKL